MKIMIIGNWRWPVYERACADALSSLGYDIVSFSWQKYFRGMVGKIYAKVPMYGPATIPVNRNILRTTIVERPEVVLIWRGTHIWPTTLQSIKAQVGSTLVSYNNDDPFGAVVSLSTLWRKLLYWRLYIKCLQHYDVNFVYRPVNISDATSVGGRNVHILMPYYIPAINKPLSLTDNEQEEYGCDIVFVGHYEPDGRAECLRALVQAGLHVRLFGDELWNRKLGNLADYFGMIQPVRDVEYTKALCGATMCLAFLSKMNRDVYTRRCFEIPACGRLLLSERTKELQSILRDGEEAVMFSNPRELVEKALWLRDRPAEVHRITRSGKLRIEANGHDVRSRMQDMLSTIENCRRADS